MPIIGADVDQYSASPEVQSALISNAIKKVSVVVYNYLKSDADGAAKGSISPGTLQNDGVGRVAFHDWDSKSPADLRAQIQEPSDGIKDGSIKIDLRNGEQSLVRTGCCTQSVQHPVL